MKATRDSYGEALVELGRENEKVVVLDADVSTATKTIKFAKEFPERFFDIGIAEADGNMWKNTLCKYFCRICNRKNL